jgi:hypothetical protein
MKWQGWVSLAERVSVDLNLELVDEMNRIVAANMRLAKKNMVALDAAQPRGGNLDSTTTPTPDDSALFLRAATLAHSTDYIGSLQLLGRQPQAKFIADGDCTPCRLGGLTSEESAKVHKP